VKVATARSVSWGSNEAVTLLYLTTYPSALSAICKHKFQKRVWLTPLTKFSVDLADSCLLLPLISLRCLSVSSGCRIINICVGHQDVNLWCSGPMAYHPHTGCQYCKLLTYLSHDCGSFSNISSLGLGGSAYGHVLSWHMFKNILAMKSTCSGCMLVSDWLPVTLCSGKGLNVIMVWNGHVEKLELKQIKSSFVSRLWCKGWNISMMNKYSELFFYVHGTMHHLSVLSKPTQCSWVVTFISLVDYCTCLGRFLHPSSGVQLYMQPLVRVHIGQPPSYIAGYELSSYPAT